MLIFVISIQVTMCSKENIICGNDIPKYILDSKCNLSQHFIRLLSEFGNRTAVVNYNIHHY